MEIPGEIEVPLKGSTGVDKVHMGIYYPKMEHQENEWQLGLYRVVGKVFQGFTPSYIAKSSHNYRYAQTAWKCRL